MTQDQGVPFGPGSRERNPQAVSAADAASIPDAEEMRIARWYGPADALAERGVHDLAGLLRSYRAVKGPAMEPIGREIARRLKRLPGWRSPLRWFRRTNVRGAWVLVSYHHRAQLCWQWSVWLSVGKATHHRSLNPLRWFTRVFGNTTVGIPWLVEISLHTQRYGYMPSSDAENMILRVAAAQGMQLREDSRSEAEAEGLQPGPAKQDAPANPLNFREDT